LFGEPFALRSSLSGFVMRRVLSIDSWNISHGRAPVYGNGAQMLSIVTSRMNPAEHYVVQPVPLQAAQRIVS
jgi:hypothetical protein